MTTVFNTQNFGAARPVQSGIQANFCIDSCNEWTLAPQLDDGGSPCAIR